MPPENLKKSFGFLTFSGGIVIACWYEMGHPLLLVSNNASFLILEQHYYDMIITKTV